MPNDTKNEEGVDFSHFYQSSSPQNGEGPEANQNNPITTFQKRKRRLLYILAAILVFLALVELSLLLLNRSKTNTSPINAPAGYRPVNPTNGGPAHFVPIKK